MRVDWRLGVLPVTLLLQACAVCGVSDVVNIRPLEPLGDFAQKEEPVYRTRLLVEDLVDIRFEDCEPDRVNWFVCMYVRLLPGATATFQSTSFQLEQPGEVIQEVSFPPQQYEESCESQGQEPLVCKRPFELSAKEVEPRRHVHSAGYKGWIYHRWVHTVEPMRTFQGQVGEPDPPAWKYFSKYSRWYEYKFQLIPYSAVTSKGMTLRMPGIDINERRYVLPPISLKKIPTEICYRQQLM